MQDRTAQLRFLQNITAGQDSSNRFAIENLSWTGQLNPDFYSISQQDRTDQVVFAIESLSRTGQLHSCFYRISQQDRTDQVVLKLKI